MNAFISWSGARSRAVAEALRSWIQDIFPNVLPFMSQQDIAAGARWNPEVTKHLSETKFGVLCVTPENAEAPWLMFEAGALAKTVSNTWVCPYLIGMSTTDLPDGPLTQFQAKIADKVGTLELVKSLNMVIDDGKRSDPALERAFEKYWPDLERAIQDSATAGEPLRRRNSDEMVAEILDIVRGLARWQNTETLGGAVRRLAQTYIDSSSPAGGAITFNMDNVLETTRDPISGSAINFLLKGPPLSKMGPIETSAVPGVTVDPNFRIVGDDDDPKPTPKPR